MLQQVEISKLYLAHFVEFVAEFVCAQELRVGTPCIGRQGTNVLRWYHNAATGECQQFTFNGNTSNLLK